MLKRKFYSTLLEWKNKKKNECLLVNGARQIGKTYIINQFGKENYENYIYINFLKNPDTKNIFEGSLEAEEIFKKVSLYLKGIKIVPHKTLIFLDEIQVCKKARTALKFLAIDNTVDVIASGSLLGIHYNKSEFGQEKTDELSIPVGYERELQMNSLDFEEFLWAVGITEDAISILKSIFEKKEKIEDSINEKYFSLFREYMVIGGMPEVINTFLQTSNFQEVFKSQQKIFKAYEDDIELYAKNTEKQKIKNCYYSLPRQLSKEYTKFQYKLVENRGSAKKYENTIDWLEDSALVKKVYNVSYPQMPLKAYEKMDSFKIYATDIGLATSLFGFETQKALLKKELVGPAKGGIFENAIFDILNKKGIPINFFKRDDNTQEIEFIFEKDSSTIPIEVKSKRGNTVSLNSFMSEFDSPYAYKFIEGNIGISEKKITMPHYFAMFI